MWFSTLCLCCPSFFMLWWKILLICIYYHMYFIWGPRQFFTQGHPGKPEGCMPMSEDFLLCQGEAWKSVCRNSPKSRTNTKLLLTVYKLPKLLLKTVYFDHRKHSFDCLTVSFSMFYTPRQNREEAHSASSSHALQSLPQLPRSEPYNAPFSSSVKLHISKQEWDSQKNFQKDKKLIRCVKSLTFRNHLGKAAHADLSTKVWML